MTDDNIDYEKLSTMVALKLSAISNASLQGQAALDDEWLKMELHKWFLDNTTFIARCVANNYEFDAAFKVKLKSIIANIY